MRDGTGAPAHNHDGLGEYAVRVRGHLADRWADWFEGFTLTREPDGITVLTGCDVDQAALHGVLRQLADLGLALLSVTPIDPPQATDPVATPSGTGPSEASAPS